VYSPDAKHIVSGSRDDTICVWDAETGQVVTGPLKGHNSSVRSVAYSPDGKHIVSGSYDKTISLWDADAGHIITSHNNALNTMRSSLNFRHNASGSSKNLFIPIVGKPTCHHHTNPLPPTIGPYCLSCTWGFPNNSTIHDGWISGPNSELIFWVPHRNRDGLLMPSMIQKMGVPVPTKLIFDHFVQGDSWIKSRQNV
jgi:WD40 repeat protein